MEPDRCPQCGAQLALVGRLHRCRKDLRLTCLVEPLAGFLQKKHFLCSYFLTHDCSPALLRYG
jgi:hypothetical protein